MGDRGRTINKAGTVGTTRKDRRKEDSPGRMGKGMQRPARHNGPVLVVDSDPDAAGSVVDSLKESGLSALAARDHAHAMSILEFRAFSVLIIGVDPNPEDRLDLIEWSRRLCPTPKIVAIGSGITLTEEHVILKRGAHLVLRKPVDMEDLLDFIRLKSARSSFAGSVEDVDILDYMQFVILGGKTTILEITSSLGTQARVFVFDGQMVHAECGVLRGVQALYRCLCFAEGTFVHRPWNEPEQMTISMPSELLLMEAARKRDDVWSGAL